MKVFAWELEMGRGNNRKSADFFRCYCALLVATGDFDYNNGNDGRKGGDP